MNTNMMVAAANEDLTVLATLLHDKNCDETHDGSTCTFPNQKSWELGDKARWVAAARNVISEAKDKANRLHEQECSSNHDMNSTCMFRFQKSWAIGDKNYWFRKANA